MLANMSTPQVVPGWLKWCRRQSQVGGTRRGDSGRLRGFLGEIIAPYAEGFAGLSAASCL